MIGVYGGSLRGGIRGASTGNEPLTLTRCHICELSQLHEALEIWRVFWGQAYNLSTLKGIFFSSLS